jgi:hypothetical protein
MLRKLVRFCDFLDCVVLKCLLEGFVVGVFSLLAIVAAGMEGMCAHHCKLFRERMGRRS